MDKSKSSMTSSHDLSKGNNNPVDGDKKNSISSVSGSISSQNNSSKKPAATHPSGYDDGFLHLTGCEAVLHGNL